jgi:hypothetical protein
MSCGRDPGEGRGEIAAIGCRVESFGDNIRQDAIHVDASLLCVEQENLARLM